MIARWYSELPQIGVLQGYEMARLVAETSERLHDAPEFAAGHPLVDHIRCTPQYAPNGLAQSERQDFEVTVAEAGCVRAEGIPHAGIFGPSSHWGQPGSSVLVEAEILARDIPELGPVETSGSDAQIREFVPLSESIDEILGHCCEYPGKLMSHPEFAIQAYWTAVLHGSAVALDFEVGPDFVSSAMGMNYQNEDGLARTCLRVMARIAAGYAADVEGHRERQGPGPNDPPLSDSDGTPVMRAYLANHTSDPHRLFWLRGKRPKFLNVTGHEGRPAV